MGELKAAGIKKLRSIKTICGRVLRLYFISPVFSAVHLQFSSGSILFYWGKKVVTVEYSFWVCFMKIKIDIWLGIRSYHLLAAITTSHSSFSLWNDAACSLLFNIPQLAPLSLSIYKSRVRIGRIRNQKRQWQVL